MLHIFTFASDVNRLVYLKHTERNHKNGINYIVTDHWNGYVDKLLYMKQKIENIPIDDIVCFIDGYDVLVNADNEEIITKFKSYNCNLVVGSELNCFPEFYKERMDAVNENRVNLYKYVNSGGYIGYAKSIMDMLNFKSEYEINQICQNGGDQSYLIEYYLENCLNGGIKLDVYCKIFQNMHWVSWSSFVFKNGIVYNTIMDVNPCFVHFNGGTWQTSSHGNIMPVFCDKIEKSKTDNITLDLDEYVQIITSTCYPHNQLLE
jgi:hypothetical protein